MNCSPAQPVEARFQLLVDAVTDYALYMLDPEGRIATWNTGAERTKGYKADEVLGQHFSRFFTPEDQAANLPTRALGIAAQEGRFEAEGWRVRRDGSLFYANSIIDAIRDADGQLIGFAKISRDITQRKEAEKSARESEQRFQLLVNSVTDYAIYMLDGNGRISTWNAGARRFKGYEAEEIIGQHFSRFFSADDREADKPGTILRTAATEGRYEGEGWRIRKDGTRFFAHVIVDAIYGEDGTVIGYAKVTRDVTDQRARESALFQSEQRFRLLVQGVKDCAIYMLDKYGNISNWNTGAEAIKGYRAEEIVGKHFSVFYTEEDRQAGAPARALDIALKAGKYETEAWRVMKNGNLFWANVLIDPIFDESGEHVGFAKVTRDASARRKADQELEDARNALLQSQKLQAVGELTGGVAHDFNNLLTVISGASEMLKKPNLPDEKRLRYLDNITETVKRASKLTSHLLAFSRRRAIQPEVIDLNIHLDALSEVLARALGSRVNVLVKPSASDARVEVDPTELETAVLNAAVNARDAMAEGGDLIIETRDTQFGGEAAVAIDITDTGTGMAPEIVTRVFEPFFTTKPVGEGTGLGLSQIHGFAAQAGGVADIKSDPGAGTTLRIILPRTEKTPVSVNHISQSEPIPEGLRVLLVDDNLQVLQFAEQLLQDLGTKVTPVINASDALLKLQDQQFDLVFSDVVMPGLSGIDLARRLKESLPNLPVLLATGYSKQMVGEGATSFTVISKPYGAETLSAAIRKLMSHGDGVRA